MLASLKSFGSSLLRHWVWSVVLVVVVALFLAAPVKNVLGKIPGVNRLPGVES